MLLVLEIMLTLTAWRKGYKGFALLPLSIAILIGLAIGSENPGADVFSYVWLDIMAIVILGAMIALAKKPVDDEVKKPRESGEFIPNQDGQNELAASQPEPEFN
jgi:hypothetical protein